MTRLSHCFINYLFRTYCQMSYYIVRYTQLFQTNKQTNKRKLRVFWRTITNSKGKNKPQFIENNTSVNINNYSITCIQKPPTGSNKSGLLQQVVCKCRFYLVIYAGVLCQNSGLLHQEVA